MKAQVYKTPNILNRSYTCRHPKCKGWYKNDWGMINGADWGCDYETTIDCDECKYGGGRKDPEAKCNQKNII
jgi:hypothetical protein